MRNASLANDTRRRRSAAAAAVGLALVLPLLVGALRSGAAVSTGHASRAAAPIPASFETAVSGALGRSSRSFALERLGAGFVASGATLRHRIDADDANVTTADGGTWGLRLIGLGRDGAVRSVEAGEARRTSPNEVRVTRDSIDSWFRNGPFGLQHGWTVRARPDGVGPLRIVLRQTGSLRGTPEPGGRALALGGGLSFSGLVAFDARGQELPARFHGGGRDASVEIRVDDLRAAYPVTVDPVVTYEQTKRLLPSGGVPFGRFGFTVALSADGATAIVGSSAIGEAVPTADPRGQVHIFVRAGSSWAHQQTLLNSGGFGGDGFGTAIAISGDGTTVLVGAPGMVSNRGLARLYRRSGDTWTKVGDDLRVSQGKAGERFGAAVALSADGSRLAIGAPGASDGRGAVHLGTIVGTAPTNGAILSVANGPPGTRLGESVAISGNGSIVLSGAPGEDRQRGAAYLFTSDGAASWSQQRLQATAGAFGDRFGSDVALTTQGTGLAVVGAPFADERRGTVIVFSRVTGTWTERAALRRPGGVADDRLGSDVAVSSVGPRILAGAEGVLGNRGAAFVFTPVSTKDIANWASQQLGATGGANERFGAAVALSGDGSSALVAATGTSSSSGSVTSFRRATTGFARDDVLLPPGGDVRGLFGMAVAVTPDGGTVVIGAPGTAVKRGAVYTFDRVGATWIQKAMIPGIYQGGGLGFDVAVAPDGNTVFASTGTGATIGGAVLALQRSGESWVAFDEIKLTGTAARTEQFGSPLVLSADGTTLLVGSWIGTSAGPRHGAAYVFTRTGSSWTQQARLVPDGDAQGTFFGASLALSGNGAVALVGAPRGSRRSYISPSPRIPAADTAGSAYLFTRGKTNRWSQERISSPEAEADDRFGTSVALSADGRSGVIGAPGRAAFKGAAYSFTRTTAGALTRRVVVRGSGGDVEMGQAVALSADGAIALVSAQWEDGGRGATYVMTLETTGWRQRQRIPGPDFRADFTGPMRFGGALALTPDARFGVVGLGYSSGQSAYVFSRRP